MTYTVTYDSEEHTLTFTSTDEVDDVSVYRFSLLTETIPGGGYTPVLVVNGEQTIVYTVSSDGVYRFKLLAELLDEDGESTLTDYSTPYFHIENSMGKKIVSNALLAVISNCKENKLRFLEASRQLLHMANVAFTSYNYVEANKLLKYLSTLKQVN